MGLVKMSLGFIGFIEKKLYVKYCYKCYELEYKLYQNKSKILNKSLNRYYHITMIQLGSHSFKSKAAAKRHMKEWIAKQSNGRISGADEPMIHDLFRLHAEYDQRSAKGISHFEIGPDHYGGEESVLIPGGHPRQP